MIEHVLKRMPMQPSVSNFVLHRSIKPINILRPYADIAKLIEIHLLFRL